MGNSAHFSFVAQVSVCAGEVVAGKTEWQGMRVIELIEQTVAGMGYELVDVETSPRGRLFRVFIDKPVANPEVAGVENAGITIEDCTAVSNQLTRLFTVEDVDYDRLEVSSPGLDRPLKKATDYVRFAGEDVQIKLRIPVGNQRNFSGVIMGMRDDRVVLRVGEGARMVEHEFPLATVDKARLVPKF